MTNETTEGKGSQKFEKQEAENVCVIDTLYSLFEAQFPELRSKLEEGRSQSELKRREEIQGMKQLSQRKIEKRLSRYPDLIRKNFAWIKWKREKTIPNPLRHELYLFDYKAGKRLDRILTQNAYTAFAKSISDETGEAIELRFIYGDGSTILKLIDQGFSVGVIVKDHIFHVARDEKGELMDKSSVFSSSIYDSMKDFLDGRPSMTIVHERPLEARVLKVEDLNNRIESGVASVFGGKKPEKIPLNFWNVVAVRREKSRGVR